MKISLLLSLLITYISANICQVISVHNDIINNIDPVVTAYRLIEGSTKFSFDLLRTLNANQTTVGQSKDLFISPYCIWSALMVTYMGARGPTRQEMRRVLGLGRENRVETWRRFMTIHPHNDILEPDETSFNSANRIFFQKGTTFTKRMRKMLYNNIAFVDFQNRADEARKIINTWVERHTYKRIKDLIPPHSINRMTKMVIANAVYFKEEWLQPFEPQKTCLQKFTISSAKTVDVTMMYTKGLFMHGKSKELQCSVLEIPYSDNSMSMIILLPDDRYSNIDNLVNKLNPRTFRRLQQAMLPKEVKVSIPKFKVEDTYELSPILQKMGLKTLFDSRLVDLSGFTGKREFSVDSVRHKTLIDVNELGSEAAASADVFFFRRIMPSGYEDFVADHPFIYIIQDNMYDTILFLGTICRPRGSV